MHLQTPRYREDADRAASETARQKKLISDLERAAAAASADARQGADRAQQVGPLSWSGGMGIIALIGGVSLSGLFLVKVGSGAFTRANKRVAHQSVQ